MTRMAMQRGGDALSVLGDPVAARVVAYLAQQRTAAITRIAFDLRLTTAEVARAVQDLREHGLVREAGAPATNQVKQQFPTPDAAASYYFLTEQGLEAARLIQGK